ncbi:hypothetical protein [Saccharopolyspora sp. ASAGF58]|uniref:hypothetical protein n=1 Tax=Saccharopolyspora sp. ASAGF58 TaxID=2719023 RepID=UPI00143FFD82|nr:hypothetical protein [Saccharopolyspora sp. ASAGF58]QIZ36397.1 hypothetical protein FDZ84_19130 [Saccharopolyspora sp. ASAGF58]
MSLEISNRNGEIPRSRRSGLDIPAELFQAVDDSLKKGNNKRVAVSDDKEAERIIACLRSLKNRHGYAFETGKERDDDGRRVPHNQQRRTAAPHQDRQQKVKKPTDGPNVI